MIFFLIFAKSIEFLLQLVYNEFINNNMEDIKMTILVTGGAGYIGSHTCVELLNAGYEIVVVDNFDNSCMKSLDAIKELTGKDFKFYEVDLLDAENLEKVLDKFFQEDFHKSGSGLGLAISNEIVKLHGGDMILNSEKGVGTSITVKIKNIYLIIL